jgi:predicted ATPase
MAYVEARLLRLTTGGPDPISVEETDHFRLMREFWSGPKEFVAAMSEE